MNMNTQPQPLELNKTYKFKLLLNNRDITFTGKLYFLNDNFFGFVDKFNKPFNYNLNVLQLYEVLEWIL